MQAALSAGYAAIDDPEVQAAFTRPADAGTPGRGKAFVAIDGMYCAACAVKIEAQIAQVPGARIDVNVAAGNAVVDWEASRAPLSAVFAAIEAAGYRPYPAGDHAQRTAADRGRRQELWRLGVAGLCMMQVMMYAWPGYVSTDGDLAPDIARLLQWASWMMSLPVVLFSAVPFYRNAWRDLRRGRVSMDLPVAIAVVVTFAASSWAMASGQGEVWFDSLTMFVFFLLGGRWLEAGARRRAVRDLERITRRLPDTVERLSGWPAPQARAERIASHRVAAGDVVRIAVGEAFPGDGTVLAGGSSADEAVLTGESRPVPKGIGDAVVAGSFNLTGPVVVRVDRTGADSRFGQVLALMEQAAAGKPRIAEIADRYARWFLLGVLLLAAVAGFGWHLAGEPRALWIAVSVLIVTCPCALSLAAPIASVTAVGRLARQGVLVSHPQALEALAQATDAVFDKTGTLTRDVPTLYAVEPLRDGVDPLRALALAAALEAGSRHPLARSIAEAARNQRLDTEVASTVARLDAVRETAGEGVSATLDGVRWRLASAALDGPVDAAPGMPADLRADAPSGAVVWLSDAEGPAAAFRFDDGLRPDAADTVAALHRDGLRTALLSGDHEAAVSTVAARAGVTRHVSRATPDGKLAEVERLQAQGARVLAVGDGINDGPLLSRADVSVAMGAGAPIAQGRADLVLLSDRLADVAFARGLAKRTLRVTQQNLAWAALYNAACVPLALAGLLPPWAAGLGMAASSLAVVLNALRLAR